MKKKIDVELKFKGCKCDIRKRRTWKSDENIEEVDNIFEIKGMELNLSQTYRESKWCQTKNHQPIFPFQKVIIFYVSSIRLILLLCEIIAMIWGGIEFCLCQTLDGLDKNIP